MDAMLEPVKTLLGITGNYQDDTINEYIIEVVSFLVGAGVPLHYISAGVVARGVSDLWNYGAGDGKLSEYFLQRATQLSYDGRW